MIVHTLGDEGYGVICCNRDFLQKLNGNNYVTNSKETREKEALPVQASNSFLCHVLQIL